MHVQVPLQVGEVDIGEVVRVVDARVVDKHVQPPEGLNGPLNQARGSFRGRDVRVVSHSRPTGGDYLLGRPSGWSGISAPSVDGDAPVIDNYVRAA